jgi:hypothetical protein
MSYRQEDIYGKHLLRSVNRITTTTHFHDLPAIARREDECSDL